MTDKPQFPANWQIKDYDPNEHLINLKGKQYLDVQNRMLWFLRDQRAFIVAGLATCAYTIHTELVELDREAGFALFKTTIRDVLGNEVIGYGSETVRDFGDYIEKASTKSQGRALLALGYGTAFAPEMDEGERVVDSPVEVKRPTRQPPQRPAVVTELASQRTTPKQQLDLIQLLRRNGHLTVADIESFIATFTGRQIEFAVLGKGQADLTISELQQVLVGIEEAG